MCGGSSGLFGVLFGVLFAIFAVLTGAVLVPDYLIRVRY